MSRLAPAPRRGFRGVALATIAAFGCATSRPPLPPPAPSPPIERVYFEEPDMEVWVEGSSSVNPAESEGARAQSQAALQAALEGRGVPAAEADAVLFLRERAVARTAGRKSSQAAATAGVVVGIVVVVAVVVIAVAAGGGKSGGNSGKGGGGKAPSIKAGGHATAPAVAAAAPRAVGAPPVHPTAPAPAPGVPSTPSPGVHPTAPAPPPGTIVARPVLVPEAPPPARFYVGVDVWPGPQPYPPDFVPPPPPPFSVKDRGFFDPDEVLLELVLRDARSGAILWGAAVRGWVDPRDRTEVAKLVEAALGAQPWARRGGIRAPAPEATRPHPAG